MKFVVLGLLLLGLASCASTMSTVDKTMTSVKKTLTPKKQKGGANPVRGHRGATPGYLMQGR
jgi:hypothetical protein